MAVPSVIGRQGVRGDPGTPSGSEYTERRDGSGGASLLKIVMEVVSFLAYKDECSLLKPGESTKRRRKKSEKRQVDANICFIYNLCGVRKAIYTCIHLCKQTRPLAEGWGHG